jgi:endonuclease III
MRILSRGHLRGVDMKNSKEYSKKIQGLYRTLSQKHAKVQKVSHKEVVDAIIHGLVSAELTEQEAKAAVQRFSDYFVDWNDLRVSRAEEVVEALGSDTLATRAVALAIIRVLNSIFNEYHKLNLEALRKAGKRPARQALEKLDGISRFAVDYCMLTSLHGHAIPLTEKMTEYLKLNELVDPDADKQQIEGFLTKQIPAKDGYEFYAFLRRESETAKSGRKRKTTTTSRKSSETKPTIKKKEKK